jgi:hypothetical protein
VSFAAITLCVASQRVFIVVVYFIIDSVRKFLDTSSYVSHLPVSFTCLADFVLCSIPDRNWCKVQVDTSALLTRSALCLRNISF